jgi:3-oxoacyl-[acyl-carrier protein] reductase
MLLEGKIAVVTGCLQGIGRATLDLFAENGADIFACCQTETEEFAEHIQDLHEQFDIDIIPVYFDFSDENSIRRAAKDIQQSKKKIDALVNIAGITRDALFAMVTTEQLRQIFDINFISQIMFTQYIAKIMVKHGEGSIINISSISALDGNPGQLAYASSKAAWIAATKTLSAELGPKGIRANVIAPGVIATAMNENLPAEALNRHMARSSIKRMGLPSEVAGAILYLASGLSSFVTGQTIRVDGGIG